MANILDFYTDIDMKDVALSPPVGVASITGQLASLSNWYDVGQYTSDTGFYRKIYSQYINASSGIVLGGTGAIATIFSSDNWVMGDNPKLKDGIWENCFFINVHDTANNPPPSIWRGIYLQFSGSQYEQDGVWHFNPYIRIGNYRAIPDNKISTKPERTGYTYYTGSTYEFAAEVSSANGWDSNSQFNQIAMYSCVIEEIEFFLFVMGVNNGALHPTNTSAAMLIPRSYFKYNIPRPYVGPVSKESAESAYIGTREKQSVLPRDISQEPNPYGFNSNGVYLCKCGRNQYNKIVNQIYTGLSGNPLNALGQIVSEVITSQGNRPRDEIQTMINGVLCCHSVPVLGGYPDTGSVSMTTLCGYPMFTAEDMTLATVDPLQQETYTTGIIPRPTGSFLDFSPYTAVSLTIPILGTVQLDPSAVLGKALSLHFGIDLFAGVLSCDISIIEPNGTEWIYTTVQANCATDMQIMGSGAQGNPILKIANALTDGATSPLSSVYDFFDGVQMFAQSTPVSRVSHTGANLLLNPYHIYLTITTPDNFNAFNFWDLAGIPSHMGGNVGMFSGYTVFEHVDLSSVSGATESELAEIDSALRGGVWL